MVLVIDIGNTNITLGCYKEDEPVIVSRMFTQRNKTSDEAATQISDILSLKNISPKDFSGVIISSVVPELTDSISKAVKMLTEKEPLLVGKQYNADLTVEVLPIEHLGADLICDCVGAIKKYPLPCLIVDMGTATKILAVDKDAAFAGCTISPGIKIALDALAGGASMLPSISFTRPEKVTGTNTVECMQSGSVYGNAAMIDGLCERMIEELGFENTTIIATGGYSKGVIPCCKTEIIYDKNLLLDGLKEIYDKAQ